MNMHTETIPSSNAPQRTSRALRAKPLLIVHPDITMSHNKKTLTDLLAALAAAEAPHVLVGGLMAGVYGKPRATVDVDLLVPRRARQKLVEAMVERGYRAQESTDMVRFFRRNEVVSAADIVWCEANSILRAASKQTVPAIILGRPVTAINRGAFMALKFHAAISPTRARGAKYQDASDMAYTVENGLSPEDEALAVKLAGKVYKGAAREFIAMLDDLRHGRMIKI